MTQINTRAAHTAAVARMSGLSAAIDTLGGQIANGKRILAPSDDAVAFTRAATLRRAAVAAEATQRSIDAAARRLTATDTALGGITNIVQRARELALQGSNGTLAPADRAVLATEVGELLEQFAGLAESRGSDGERLFGGAAADRPTYAADANGIITWQGAGRAPALEVGGAVVQSGIEGPDAFGTTDPTAGTKDLFAALTALQVALNEPDKTLRQVAMADMLAQTDAHIDRLATTRAIAGARLARLDTETDRIARNDLAAETDLTKLESLDMPTAIARLQHLVTVLKATQGSFVITTNLSLWDQLR